MKKILVNVVHPDIEKSIVNKRLIEGIQDMKNITINNLYEKYLDFKIDVKEEQKLLLEHDTILFQFPMYWFSSPSLLKEWFDAVLAPGFAHAGASMLKDKTFAVAVSCGGAKKAFSATGKDKKTVEEFLYPFEITAEYVKMNYKKAYITYDTETVLSEETLNKYTQDYITYVKEL
ncbi:general stress protein [Arcobacter sp. CECT 8989]|uniref:NAD(P)H-dependent oxidoreductase n=1 Tax=Arcobacter sp. CECT 8989 TaxID=2044509 RepID=UPI00100B01F8|nr:NAD(P)H-dependent oxidoreductase [Arcobacter sp. CECT 8989]RXK01862.1 general stress protein [Arcobacter sp. CECT 8989]